ncbi:tetratricopeptide repeat protein [Sphingomicrobium sp. XHP0239]|uniref:tetratricopeptide repeat protein n=1 Tax=Sphingomicrobium maritimum TaxID=3133972 RepID=UPI0031CCAEEF
MQQADALLRQAASEGADPEALDEVTADLAYARGDHPRALASYMVRLHQTPEDQRLLERAAMAAMKAGRDDAAPLLERACASTAASWVVLNGCAVSSDRERDFAASTGFYQRAIALRPENATLYSNLGWSLMLQGRWREARAPLVKALVLEPRHARAQSNLDLLDLVDARSLPVREPGETDEDYARRLNDAGIAAAARGERDRAIVAFAHAVEVRPIYYEKAAANLAAVEEPR